MNRIYKSAKSCALKPLLCLTLQPITNSPPKWMAELESEDIEMLKGECRVPTGA